MKDELTEQELTFLASQRLGPDDVFDARGLPQWLWKQRAKEAGKTLALGNKCRDGGHRLKTRGGHCIQCNTSRLGFQKPHDAEQYVYIAGSLSERLIKIGTCGQSGGLRAKARVYWGFLRAHKRAENVGRGQTGGGRATVF